MKLDPAKTTLTWDHWFECPLSMILIVKYKLWYIWYKCSPWCISVIIWNFICNVRDRSLRQERWNNDDDPHKDLLSCISFIKLVGVGSIAKCHTSSGFGPHLSHSIRLMPQSELHPLPVQFSHAKQIWALNSMNKETVADSKSQVQWMAQAINQARAATNH